MIISECQRNRTLGPQHSATSVANWAKLSAREAGFFLTLREAKLTFTLLLSRGARESMDNDISRRGFLSQTLTGISAAWVSANWPAMLSAANHARQAAQSASPAKVRIFFSRGGRGSRCYLGPHHSLYRHPRRSRSRCRLFHRPCPRHFCKRQSNGIYRRLVRTAGQNARNVPAVEKFSAATPEQQDEILQALDEPTPAAGGRRSPRGAAAQTSSRRCACTPSWDF